ncbi:MAG TPA: cytochrome c [Steroidobacteraceae bacterium]
MKSSDHPRGQVKHTRSHSAWMMIIGGSFSLILAALAISHRAIAEPPAEERTGVLTSDPYQRSDKIYQFHLLPGDRIERGKEIYLFTCWLCHNEYTTREDYAPRAPTLYKLYERPVLMTGEPLNDRSVGTKIQLGGPGMPGFQAFLDSEELADVVAYLRSGRCCWDENHPPANPWYGEVPADGSSSRSGASNDQ